METEEELAIPVHDIVPRVASLQEDQRNRAHKHRELQKQAHRYGKLFAALLVGQTFGGEPRPDAGGFIPYRTSKAIYPKEQEVYDGKDGTGNDKLLRHEAREREIRSEER